MLSLLAFLVILGVLVTGHEFGHFIVAKLAGVKVEVFSIGFGQALIKKKIGETEYRIAWLPIGGYVKMLGQEGPDGDPIPKEEIARALPNKPAAVRIAIALAGPVMNILMPIGISVALYGLSPNFENLLSSRVGAVDEGLSAYNAGLRAGDQIVAIDHQRVDAFWEVSKRIGQYDESLGPMRFQVLHQGATEPVELALTPDRIEETDSDLNVTRVHYRIGYQPYYQASDVVLGVKGGLLEQAGLQNFDRIVAINGIETRRYFELEQLLKAAQGTLTLKVLRGSPLMEQMPFLQSRTEHTLTVELSEPKDLSLELQPAGRCIASVQPGLPFKEGDCLMAVDGERHSLGAFLLNALQNRPGEPRKITVLRDGEEIEITHTLAKETWTDPLAGEVSRWRTGFMLFSAGDGMVSIEQTKNEKRLAFAWHHAMERVWGDIDNTLQSLLGMVRGNVSPTQLSGPVTIFYLAGEFAQAGFEQFLRLMVLLSLSIAVLNLVPIPGLDGGQILVAFVEGIMRRPLPEKVRMGLQVAGLLCIVGLMLFALGNDLMRLWRISHM